MTPAQARLRGGTQTHDLRPLTDRCLERVRMRLAGKEDLNRYGCGHATAGDRYLIARLERRQAGEVGK